MKPAEKKSIATMPVAWAPAAKATMSPTADKTSKPCWCCRRVTIHEPNE
jgi:hypothetical protein